METPQRRVLVVDDDRLQLQALSEGLAADGWQVTASTAADDALGRIAPDRFEVLLSDLRMPGLDGIELVRRALAADADIAPVLVTGQGSIPSAVTALQAGAIDYVLKPVRMAALRPVLGRALEIRSLRVRNRELERRVAARSAELEAANRELDAFAGRLAHDLRQPVSVVRGFSRLLEERFGAGLPAEAGSYLRHVIDASERADRLIRDLLAFARLGAQPLQSQPVDLNAVVRQAQAMAALELAPERPVDWQIDPLPVVPGDPSLLQQVFVNLLTNALKYTRPRERARIHVRHREEPGGRHLVEVEDNGVGFDPERAGRLFSPFERLHRASEFEGTGMGLANVRRIVHKHGGSVEGTSEPGHRTVFAVRLPATPEAAG
jgi:signal transduction histidine kinase